MGEDVEGAGRRRKVVRVTREHHIVRYEQFVGKFLEASALPVDGIYEGKDWIITHDKTYLYLSPSLFQHRVSIVIMYRDGNYSIVWFSYEPEMSYWCIGELLKKFRLVIAEPLDRIIVGERRDIDYAYYCSQIALLEDSAFLEKLAYAWRRVGPAAAVHLFNSAVSLGKRTADVCRLYKNYLAVAELR